MKKSIFVTTIVMALVIVLAMTTATFAWFSTSQDVTVSGLSISARTVEGAQLILRNVNGGTPADGSRLAEDWQNGAVTLSASGTLEPLSGIIAAADIAGAANAVPAFTFDTDSTIFHKASEVVVATNQAASVNNQSIKTTLLTGVTKAGVDNNNFVTAVFQITDSNYSNPAEQFTITPTIVLPSTPTTADNLLSGAIKVAFFQMESAVTSSLATDNNANYDTDSAYDAYELVKIWAPNSSVNAAFSGGKWVANPAGGSNNNRYLNNGVAIDTSTAYAALISDTNSAEYEEDIYTSTTGLTLPAVTFDLGSENTSYGLVTEVVIVIWLDGLDAECVNGASGGSLSLSLLIKGVNL